MPDRPFISIELDHRIALAQRRIGQGQANPVDANRALMPWAAAEAWIVGYRGCHAVSPRDGISRAGDLCPLPDTIAELARARDAIARQIEQGQRDKLHRWRGIGRALRDLERLQDWRTAFRTLPAPQRNTPCAATKPALPPAAPSLLADMFGADGKPLPIERRAA